MSNFEAPLNADVARIAIINEIVRDFWVASGYDYNAHPFIYDFDHDDYISKDYETGNYILPSMDAVPNINIIKYDLHHLYFVLCDGNSKISGKTYLENGRIIENPIFKWAYNDNYNTEEIEYQKLNDMDIPIHDDYEYEYHSNFVIGKKSKIAEFKLESFNGFNTCSSYITLNYCSPIYYGLVDNSLVNGTNSDIYSNHPTDIIKILNKVIQPRRDLTLDKYVIGNNKRFVYAVPKEYACDEDGTLLLTFFLPDINSPEVINANMDDKSTPIYTDGVVSSNVSDYSDGTENSYEGGLRELNAFTMQQFKNNVIYTNQYGYQEEYMIFISNGYFTRLYDNIGFDIKVK